MRLIERGATAEEIREIPVTQAEFLIGRGADCDLRLRAASVSRHHCLIRPGAECATLTDLGSSNGSYLNGQRVRSQADLHSGDELKVGTFTFLVALGDERVGPVGDSIARTVKMRQPPAGDTESKPK